jgi:hypothetical protein
MFSRRHVARRAWLVRNWWWMCAAYGTTIIVLFWSMIWHADASVVPDPDATMFAVAMAASALSGVLMKICPGYGKTMTRRQARFNPGNDR